MATDELLTGRSPQQALTEVIGFIRTAVEDDDIHIDKAVADPKPAPAKGTRRWPITCAASAT